MQGFNKKRIYLWSELHWDVEFTLDGIPLAATPLCPKLRCNCPLRKAKDFLVSLKYDYECVSCDFKIVFDVAIEQKSRDVLGVIWSKNYIDAEIINIDGELLPVAKELVKDSEYWIDVKISKNKKQETQLMILAGRRNEKDKTQLFIDGEKEKMTFDQNNHHPSVVFVKVQAIFNKSKLTIESK